MQSNSLITKPHKIIICLFLLFPSSKVHLVRLWINTIKIILYAWWLNFTFCLMHGKQHANKINRGKFLCVFFFKVQNGNDTHFWLFWGDFLCYGKTENCKTFPFGNVKNIWNVCYLNSFWKYLSAIVKPKRQTLPQVIEMAKHLQFPIFFFLFTKKGFFQFQVLPS